MASIAVFGQGGVGKDRVIAAIELGNYKIKNSISGIDMNLMLKSNSNLNPSKLFSLLLINFQNIMRAYAYQKYLNTIVDE